MNPSDRNAWDDTVLPFQLDRADIRGRMTRLDSVLERILGQHAYPAPVEAMVAEACVLTALIGQTIELRWKLSLQIRGDGPLRLIATDFLAPDNRDEPARIRAYAAFDAGRIAAADEAPFAMIGRGMFAILIDQGKGTTPYQGITRLTGGSLSASASAYFKHSEQLPTRFATAMGKARVPGEQGVRWRAGGIMIQHMPAPSAAVRPDRTAEENTAESVERDAENWRRVNLLLDTVEEIELIGPLVSPAELIHRLFHEETPRIYEAQPVRFGCTCSPDKVRQAMSIYSARDITHMTTRDGKVTADCQFCGAHYEFDPEELGFEAKKG